MGKFFTTQPEVAVTSQNGPAFNGADHSLGLTNFTITPPRFPSPADGGNTAMPRFSGPSRTFPVNQRNVVTVSPGSYERGRPYHKSVVELYHDEEKASLQEEIKGLKAQNAAMLGAEAFQKTVENCSTLSAQIPVPHKCVAPAAIKPAAQPRFAPMGGDYVDEHGEQYVALEGGSNQPKVPTPVRRNCHNYGGDGEDEIPRPSFPADQTDAASKADADVQASNPKKRAYKPRAPKTPKTPKAPKNPKTAVVDTAVEDPVNSSDVFGPARRLAEETEKTQVNEPEAPQPKRRGRPPKNNNGTTASTASSTGSKKKTTAAKKAKSAEQAVIGDVVTATEAVAEKADLPVLPNMVSDIAGLDSARPSNKKAVTVPNLPTPKSTPVSTSSTLKRQSEVVDDPQVRGSPTSKRQKVFKDQPLTAMPKPDMMAGKSDSFESTKEGEKDIEAVRNKTDTETTDTKSNQNNKAAVEGPITDPVVASFDAMVVNAHPKGSVEHQLALSARDELAEMRAIAQGLPPSLLAQLRGLTPDRSQ